MLNIETAVIWPWVQSRSLSAAFGHFRRDLNKFWVYFCSVNGNGSKKKSQLDGVVFCHAAHRLPGSRCKVYEGFQFNEHLLELKFYVVNPDKWNDTKREISQKCYSKHQHSWHAKPNQIRDPN